MPDQEIRQASLEYHRLAPAGKISVTPTKQLTNQRDLALAYTPGVAAACDEIVRDPAEARNLTSRGNLIGVVTNGTAVLGLGNIGPLASKPVMEGKAVLFKKFAGIDCFDIEINEHDPDKLVDIIASLEPTFGGINLEDIKAPECFYVERKLRERMKIPVFHDDQHGTAIIVGAAIYNGLRVVGKDIAKVKLVCSGAGAAALACLDLLVSLGVRRENIFVSDICGVVYSGRVDQMDDNKARYCQDTKARTLEDILPGADIFLGLSAARVLKPEWLALMAPNPLIMALANPEPEIMPDVAKAARPDAVIATGRSDFPNQVNNVLCFPFIFRGALDVGATTINEAMKLATVRAIADLAMAEQSDIVAHAYGIENLRFGAEYLIPKPFDPRLIVMIAPAVAKAAMESGVATRPIDDFGAYKDRLIQFVYHSGLLMKPIFTAAKNDPKRIVFPEGEDERVLRAVQVVVDEGLAKPILVGRPAVLERRIERYGLRIKAGEHFEVINPEWDSRFKSYWTEYHRLTGAARHLRRLRSDRDASAPHVDRRDGDAHGRRRRHALRHLRHPSPAPGFHRPGDREAQRREDLRRDEWADAAFAHGVHRRHLRQSRPDGGGNRRDRDPRGRGDQALRHDAESGPAFAFELRNERAALGSQDAAGARHHQRPRSDARGRWRNAWRRRAIGRSSDVRAARLEAQRRREPADHAHTRCRQHLVQPAQGCGRRWRDARPDPARRCQAGAHPDTVRHRAPHRQHDGADRRGRERRAIAASRTRRSPD
jgi:malic enzyme